MTEQTKKSIDYQTALAHSARIPIAAELRRMHTLNIELLAALQGLVAIATDSDGVAGYHLNGDIAEWASFPEWHEAHAAIAKAKGEQR